MFLTDYEQKVLENLRDCVARNFPATAEMDVNSNISAMQPSDQQLSAIQHSDSDDFCDPDDAESCDDMDDLFRPNADSLAIPSNTSDIWDYVSAALSLMLYATVSP